MKFTIGQSVVETDNPDEISQILGMLGLEVKPQTAVEQAAEALSFQQANTVPEPEPEPAPEPKPVLLDEQHHPTPRDMPVMCARGVSLPPLHMRKGYSIYLPVTEAERHAINIMRTDKNREWTANHIVSRFKCSDPVMVERVKAAPSALERAGRGVVSGSNTLSYRLDEFGKYAVLIEQRRPGYDWKHMRQAAIEGRDFYDDRPHG